MATLVIHTQGTIVEGHGERLEVITPDGHRQQFPLIGIERVHCYGKIQLSHNAICLLSEHGHELAWFSRRGRLRARLAHAPGRGLDLRRAQYQLADAAGRAHVYAQRLVQAKIANQRAVLVRAWRHRPEAFDQRLLDDLGQTMVAVGQTTEAAAILGHEGTAARRYFAAWAACMAERFPWNGRNRRPPRDPLNVLLSLGYTLLANEVTAQAEAIGLDIWQGVLHAARSGRPSLALDLMEPLRPILVDRLILDLVTHGRITAEHFLAEAYQPPRNPDRIEDTAPEPGYAFEQADGTPPTLAPRLTDEGFRRYITRWERRLAHADKIDPGEDAPLTPGDGLVKGRALIHDQVQAFAEALRAQEPDLFTPIRLRT